MIDCDDYVSLSDDDNVSEVTSKTDLINNNAKAKDAIETIDLEEDMGHPSTHSDNQHSADETFVQSIHKIQQENGTFSHFLDICLDLENSDGMMRFIQRAIRSYEQCDNGYKKSKDFLSIVKKAISRLEKDPDHKFSHLKTVCVAMKTKRLKKKRVELVTLATNLKGKFTPGLHSKSKSKHSKTTQINNNHSIVIDSDDDNQHIPTISLDDNSNDGLESEKENQRTENTTISLDDNSNDGLELEKENQRTENSPSKSQDNHLVPQEVPYESSQESLIIVEPKVLPIEYEQPRNMPPQANMEVLDKVKALEQRIAFVKKEIAILERMEVTDDSVASPYIMCESYKGEVVKLYREICFLIGEQPVKKRKVRLKVGEGHPLGPVQRLESFINRNIGEDGVPIFPDFSEVIQCVMVANLEDNLGWPKQQVIKEANALFTQCGRALQKKRQKREYRDLMALVKEADHDPADDDPELRRRLESNRKAAIRKERDLLERFAQLQDLPQRPRSGSTLHQDISEPDMEPDSTCSGSPPPATPLAATSDDIRTIKNVEQSEPNPCSADILVRPPSDDNRTIRTVEQSEPHPCSADDNRTIRTVEQSEPKSSSADILVRLPSNDNRTIRTVEQSDPNLCSADILVLVTENNVPETENHDIKKEIKKEPVDIIKLLEELGDDYTISVSNIEDPFLVIEISSDSSDDDDMDCEML